MLSNCREALQMERSEITFLDLHHWRPAPFCVCDSARGKIRALTYIRMHLEEDV